jgi:CheY-like chemotaxis protein
MPVPCDVVLVIEDHEDLREGIRIALMLYGYTVEVAANGREALAKLYAGLQPGVIIMDLMMPVMNGFEFREAQLADPDLAKIPLIAYSGVTDPSETAQHLHADAYLHKPTDVERVAMLVQQFCPKHTAAESTP